MGPDNDLMGIVGYGYWGPNLARNAAEAEVVNWRPSRISPPRLLSALRSGIPGRNCTNTGG